MSKKDRPESKSRPKVVKRGRGEKYTPQTECYSVGDLERLNVVEINPFDGGGGQFDAPHGGRKIQSTM